MPYTLKIVLIQAIVILSFYAYDLYFHKHTVYQGGWGLIIQDDLSGLDSVKFILKGDDFVTDENGIKRKLIFSGQDKKQAIWRYKQ